MPNYVHYPLILVLTCSAGLAIPAGPPGAPEGRYPAGPGGVDHGRWQGFLDSYLDSSFPDGIHRVRYGRIPPSGRDSLSAYLADLQKIPVSSLDRAEQMAYWINLYNSMTVEAVLRRYPVASIRDIRFSLGLPKTGPWNDKLMIVEGRSLSLNDVEHRILRRQWKDPRIHFALNCASLGCPDLPARAFMGKNLDSLLEQGARGFLRSPRGASFEGGDLVLSSLFDWYEDDFGGERKRLEFIARYAPAPLRERIAGHAGRIRFRYDWGLNDAGTD